MKRLLFFFLITATRASAQELFVYTEPASNMPAHSLGLRLNNRLMQERSDDSHVNYHFIPEAMWGVNKSLMLHAESFFSNRGGSFLAEGAAVYAKWRIYSKDTVHRHFRAALYGRLAYNNSAIHMEEIETNGHNSGVEAGIIATQLLHRIALSATASFEQAWKNNTAELPQNFSPDAVNYTLSAGHLFFPKDYRNYRQTNVNAMLEILGQSNTGSGKYFVDAAPALQFIFNSQTRVDVGYKFELSGNMERTAPNGFLIRIEHLFFNAL